MGDGTVELNDLDATRLTWAGGECVDSSERFIMPGDSPYLDNAPALWQVDRALAARVDAIDKGYAVEAARSGEVTAAVRDGAGRRVYLHSRYEPGAEGRKLVEEIDAEQRLAFYVFGFGLGYHVEALFDRAGGEAVFFVFEPDERLLRTALAARDLRRLIESGRVHFLTRPDKSELISRLSPHLALLSMGVARVDHPASIRLHEAFFQRMRQWIEEWESYARTSLSTVLLNSERTAQNITRNLGWYAACPGLERLRGRFAGKPGIVVSAGPSLRKNQLLLPEAAGKAVIIAVQTTFKPLLAMGVEPHFVTSLDYHDICTRFFEDLPRRPDGGPVRTELVAEPKASSAIFAMHPGAVSLLGNEYAESLLREQRPAKAVLPAGATVAHLACYLAEFLGCDPIIFVGQDLGFSDGLCYAPGTSYEDVWRPELGRFCTLEMKQWEQIVRERFILRRIPDYTGAPMYTEERLFMYLQQFERDFLRSGRTIIDATEGGAAKQGTIVMPLREAIDAHCTAPLEVDLSDHPGADWGRAAACASSLRRRRDEAETIERIGHETMTLLEALRDRLDDQQAANALIARIDGLRARMNEVGETYDLVAQLTQRSQLDRFEADRRLAAARVDGAERQRRQIERDIANVRAITEAARQFAAMMEEASRERGKEKGERTKDEGDKWEMRGDASSADVVFVA